MFSELEIILVALVAIFGTATVLLVLYIVLTKCRSNNLACFNETDSLPRESTYPSSLHGVLVEGGEQHELQPIPHGLLADGGEQHELQPITHGVLAEGGDYAQSHEQQGTPVTQDDTDEQQDVLAPLPRRMNMPHLTSRLNNNKRKTIDIFIPQLDVPMGLIRSHTIAGSAHYQTYDTTSQRLSVLSAIQNFYENWDEDTRQPTQRGNIRSIIGPSDFDYSGIEEIIIQDVSVLDLGKTPPTQIQEPVAAIETRPKSFAAVMGDNEVASAKKTNTDVSHGMFISKSIGKNGAGGTIELYGVRLEIPSGALSKSQKICLGVMWTADHQPQKPKLGQQEAILSPIVSCEPHGLQLKKDAILTLPHCAHEVSKNWKVNGWCSQTSTSAKTDWTRLKIDDVDISRRHIKIKTNHFTLYTVSGEATMVAEKWVELIAFAPLLTGKQLPIRVYCLNDYTDDEARDTKKMNKSEEKQKGKEVTSPMPITVCNDGKNLILEVETISESWTLSSMCDSKQVIPFDQIWQARAPSGKFVLQSTVSPPRVECSILGYQVGHTNFKQKLTVSEERQARGDSRIDLVLIETVFTGDLSSILEKMLDPDNILNNNWVALAEHMDLPPRDIHWLADDCRKKERSSPTRYLLNVWVKTDKTLQQFETAMTKIERYDVLDEIHRWRSNQAENS